MLPNKTGMAKDKVEVMVVEAEESVEQLRS